MEYKKTTKRFEANKINFLEENYSNEITKTIYYNIWDSTISYLEEIKQKDLYEFTSEEIQELMSTIPTASTSHKGNVTSFISNYFEYCIEKGFANTNPIQSLDRNMLTKVNSKVIKNKMMSKRQLHKLCVKMTEFGNVFQILPFILARYGIMGSKLDDMCNLRWEDIDRVNMKVSLIDKETGEIRLLDIDDIFLYWIDKAKDTCEYEVRKYSKKQKKWVISDNIKFIDYGFVLKVSSIAYFNNSTQQDAKYIYRETIRVCESSNIKKPTLNSLLKAEKIERLLEIRATRRITTEDCHNTMLLFSPSTSRGSYTTLKRDYESITKEVVYPTGTSLSKLKDEKAKETAEQLRREIFGE